MRLCLRFFFQAQRRPRGDPPGGPREFHRLPSGRLGRRTRRLGGRIVVLILVYPRALLAWSEFRSGLGTEYRDIGGACSWGLTV